MISQPSQLHINDREIQASQLGLSLSEFDRLLTSANHAYELLKESGPFYGNEDIKDPTFRVTAEPVVLPQQMKQILEQFGKDVLLLGRALPLLPKEYKKLLGEDIDFSVPLSLRIDAIYTKEGALRINEIEGVDGASALMMAEQFAYDLQSFDKSTAAYVADAIQKIYRKKVRVAFIRGIIHGNPHTPNAQKFAKYIEQLSHGQITIDLLDGSEITAGNLKIAWNLYDGIFNESKIPTGDLFKQGVKEDQILSSGYFNALGDKGLLALIFDHHLSSFWEKTLGKDVLRRLQTLLIPSSFIYSQQDLQKAQKRGQVVKVTKLIDRSKGVAMPSGDIEQSSKERWDYLHQLHLQGMPIIAQNFIEPAKISSFLRKKGTSLEQIEWYNRICVKYVFEGDS